MTNTLIIGVDGATFKIIDQHREHLDNISRLMDEGYEAVLRSTRPSITSVAWPAFATGQNPGRFGMFDFMNRDPESLTFSLHDTRRREFDFFWEFINGTTGIASVPMIPYHDLDGFFIQGSLARVDSDRTVFPPELDQRIPDVYEYLIDTSDPTDEIVSNIKDRVDARKEVYCDLVQNHDVSIGFLMFSAVDFVQHHFWAHAHSDHPAHRPSEYDTVIREVYKKVDDAIGSIISHVPDDTNVVLASDHGFTQRHTNVNLNAFLRREGYLSFVDSTESRLTDILYNVKNTVRETPLERLVPDSLRQNVKDRLPGQTDLKDVINWSKTSAYSFGAGGNIYLNRAGREREGTVQDNEFDAMRSEISSALRGLTDPRTGDRVVSEVHPGGEVYEGPYVSLAPDLVVEPADGYHLTAKQGTDVFERQTDMMPNSGMHERPGILVASGPDVMSGGRGKHDIFDVAPTLLHLHGAPVPEQMDGTVIKSMTAVDRPIEYTNVHKNERRRIRNRVLSLRQLGHI